MTQKEKQVKAILLWLKGRTTYPLYLAIKDKVDMAATIDDKLALVKGYQQQVLRR